jgi:prolyl-tRNA synthetase
MPEDFLVTCPFCGEQVQIYVEADVTGVLIQDCEVCCNPWRVYVSGRDEDREVHVTRADGSE